jgi:hypothetical protein
MHTSYFYKSGKHKHSVSIAGKCPLWYTGREYKKLAPKFWFFQKYKEDGDEEFYTIQYKKEVLNVLDPLEVYNELGTESILLCYESPEKFCHRHLVANWFEENLNIKVIEI